VTSYLLIGLVFANVYELLFLIDPQALRFADDCKGERLGFGEILYFSYVTLTTVGYGDVSSVHRAARAVAIVEPITGLMLVSIDRGTSSSATTARRSRRSSLPAPPGGAASRCPA
jgi:voltage-gated potassium channel Kch